MSTSEVGSSYTLWKARPVQKEHTMSDNLRRYRAIRDALTQGYPGQPTGTVARHLTTLAALISGIVGSKSTQLPKIAAHVPDGAQPESRVKRFARWLRNDHVTEEGYFVPFTKKRREAPAFMPGMDRRWARRAQCPRAQQDPRSA